MARTPQRGTTLIELVIVLALSAVLVGMVIVAMIDLDRTRKPREVSALIQGEGRSGLASIESDLRLASLGAGSGVVFLEDGGTRELPAVQIIDDIPDVGEASSPALRAKPGTDAILIVREIRDPGVVVEDRHVGEMGSVTVHGPATSFAQGDNLLLGDYGDATWAHVDEAQADGDNTRLTLSHARIPSRTLTKLAAGSHARRAVARLYFVSADDELVRAELSSPRLSEDTEVLSREVVACPSTGAPRGCGIENLQIGCELDDGTAPQDCPEPWSGAAATEIGDLFGVTFAGGQGPRLSADVTRQTISQLRTVSLSIAVRSGTPLIDTRGDPKIELDGVTLPVALQPDDREYVRRAYQITAAIRNTSLGVL